MFIWRSRKFWRWEELVAGLMAALAGIFVVLDWKLIGACLASGSGICVLLARHRIEAIDTVQRASDADLVLMIIGDLLEGLRVRYFTSAPPGTLCQHRVTLYVCQGSASGPGKHLKCYARAGVPQPTTTWAVDNQNKQNCEGIAGLVWFNNAIMTVPVSPDWNTNLNAYASAVHLTLAKAAVLTEKSRAVTGAVVRVAGMKWGVLLLDSDSAGLITNQKHFLIQWFANLLGNVIARGP
jgi:hypothetical protein